MKDAKLLASGQQTSAIVAQKLPTSEQSFGYVSDDIYATFILEEAEKLYTELTTKLTNEIIAAASAIRTSSSIPLPE